MLNFTSSCPPIRSFLGLTVDTLVVNEVTRYPFNDFACDRIETTKYVPISLRTFKLHAKLQQPRDVDYRSLRQWQDSAYNQLMIFSDLGDTVVCASCSFAMRPGAISCHRCGGQTIKVISSSRYEKLFVASLDSLNTEDWLGRQYVYLDLSIFGGFCLSENASVWQTTHASGWICAYCNSVNRHDKVDCTRCGGGQLPYSDLKRMDSVCLYCGRELKGETVCQDCSDARSGYSVWPPRC